MAAADSELGTEWRTVKVRTSQKKLQPVFTTAAGCANIRHPRLQQWLIKALSYRNSSPNMAKLACFIPFAPAEKPSG
jgi:hypothetical protein